MAAQKVPFQIFIHIIEARGLQGLSGNHMSDAYAVTQVGPATRYNKRTEAKYGTVNAVWQTKYLFEDVMLTEDEFQKEKIAISVWDRNVFSRNEMIGLHEFSLSNIIRQKGCQYDRKWFPLTLPNQPGTTKGFVLMTMYVLRPGTPTPQPEEKEEKKGAEEEKPILTDPKYEAPTPYLLNVLIYKGAHILHNNKLPIFGAQNPYVVCRFNGNLAQTAPHVNTENPTWNTKLVMPFNMPLTSESIEIQLWNRMKGMPDQMIGEESYNYYKLGLTHKAFGPKWVNLYSSEYTSKQVTWLGQIKDQLEASGRNNPEKSEYVGRLLVRLSVTPTEKNNQRLLELPCSPVPIPNQIEYALDVLLYSSLEVPVMGGQIKVEVGFGEKRMESTSRLGKDGVFRWYERLTPILTPYEKPLNPDAPSITFLRLHGPADLEQLHDIVISVFHVVGGVTRKIAFKRLKPKQLMPGRDTSYQCNGQHVITRKSAYSQKVLSEMWAPRWYTLTHNTPDPDNSQLIAGFLLASIGFGKVDARPSVIPRPIRKKLQRFTLRCYIYQGANLLAANASGNTTNPFLLIRMADKVFKTKTVQDTTFPFWYEYHDMQPLLLDPDCLPSVFVNLYHDTMVGYTQIGRCEVLGKHVAYNAKRGKVCRYQLYYDPSETENDMMDPTENTESAKKEKDLEKQPYIMACFQLFKYVKSTKQRMKSYPIKKEWSHEAENLDDAASGAAVKKKDYDGDEKETKNDDTEMDEMESDALNGGGNDRGMDDEEEDPTASLVSEKPMDIYYKPTMRKYMVKIELVGLRNIRTWLFSASSRLRMELTIPNIEMMGIFGNKEVFDKRKLNEKQLLHKKIISKDQPQGFAMQLSEAFEWEELYIPEENPNGIAMRIRVFEETTTGDVLLGQTWVHLVSGKLIPDLSDIKGPEFYQYKGFYDMRKLATDDDEDVDVPEGKQEKKADADEEEDSEEEVEEMDPEMKKMQDTLIKEGILDGDTPEEAARKATLAAGGSADDARKAAEAEKEKANEAKEAKNNKKIQFKGVLDTDGNPVLDLANKEDELNIFVEKKLEVKKEEKKEEGEEKKEGKDGDKPLLDKDGKAINLPMMLPLMTGKQVGFSTDQLRMLMISKEVLHSQAALLKLYVTATRYVYPEPAIPLEKMTEGQKEKHKNLKKKVDDTMLETFSKIDNLKWIDDNVFKLRYISRLYVYEAKYLSPREALFSPSETANPFLVVTNGMEPESTINTRVNARVNDLNPDLQRVFELQTEFPKNNLLEIQVWNKDDVVGDDLIGSYTFDVEDLLIRGGGGTCFIPSDYYSLTNSTSSMTQGKLKMKLDILTEDEARRTKADEMQNADPDLFELRMVIWNTRDIRMPDDKDKDKDVDQKMFVTVNFDGTYGGDITKSTDVAWFSAGGAAEWNWRMVWKIHLPCQVPRVKISMWDECVMTDSEAVGEVNFNLQPFFDQCNKDKKEISNNPQQWLPLTHPNYPGVAMGEVNLEFWLYNKIAADKTPVGEAQNEPNVEPYLPSPHRNPPPWAVGSRMLGWMDGMKMMILCAVVFVIILAVAVPVAVMLATKP